MNKSQLISSEIKKRIFILDGAMGTVLQQYNLSEQDFRGKLFKNHTINIKNNFDILCITKPEIIKEVHKKYLIAGADIITTNTFNANKISQKKYGLSNYVYEINLKAAQIAQQVANKFQETKFVAGSIGPSNKTFSASSFNEIIEAYSPQIKGLLDGCVDILLIETIFDIKMAKTISQAIEVETEKRNINIPIIISATINHAGKILSGENINALIESFSNTNLLSIGLNCSFGANEMLPYLTELSKKTNIPITAFPNAGLPNKQGKYKQTPEEFALEIKELTTKKIANIVGGCCGTTPEYIKKIHDTILKISQ